MKQKLFDLKCAECGKIFRNPRGFLLKESLNIAICEMLRRPDLNRAIVRNMDCNGFSPASNHFNLHVRLPHHRKTSGQTDSYTVHGRNLSSSAAPCVCLAL